LIMVLQTHATCHGYLGRCVIFEDYDPTRVLPLSRMYRHVIYDVIITTVAAAEYYDPAEALTPG